MPNKIKPPQTWICAREYSYIQIFRRNGTVIEYMASNEDVPLLSTVRWNIDGAGRAYTYQMGCAYMAMHRAILMPPDGLIIDHINGDFTDNRRSNLRICTHAENLRNRRVHRNSASKYKGVSIDKDGRKRPYRAKIGTVNGLINIGSFESEVEAALAYDKAALEMYGEFAKTNALMGLL